MMMMMMRLSYSEKMMTTMRDTYSLANMRRLTRTSKSMVLKMNLLALMCLTHTTRYIVTSLKKHIC
ncbi:hypothetical protein ZEAMMB73_Zm00001d003682 [Zea mays]|uniref:Uncharacterized protein n=1 Tax=Zea mays TaxID=4577 RepID=A0A1D6EAX5_MAIZE|nr:hypothetical protein ZEAMMB73_Zm00001d003682 [Zea mays]